MNTIHKQNKVTILRLQRMGFDAWIRQNGGECIDCLEGVLTDNFLISCRRGYAVAKETFVNEWSSTHTIYFQPYPSPDVLDKWDEMTRKAEQVEAAYRYITA